jgi:SAM-dependent methyltransferase
MHADDRHRSSPNDPTAYLVVDDFLQTLVATRTLKTALELRLVDRLEATESMPVARLLEGISGDATGLRLLVEMLEGAGVIERSGSEVALSARFRSALAFRDLLEAKLAFTGLVLKDFVERFTQWVVDPPGFQREADLYRLFDYGRCFDASRESYERTRRWVRLTTALTKYEGPVCLRHHDFGRHRRMLDVGGNSGEFALRACRAHPGLRATVLDLPLVCEIGQEHLLAEPERERISFVAGSALETPLPAGCDLITFKSMLHDWPEVDARRMLARAADALQPGGTLLVFERGPLDLASGPTPFGALPILLFARSYRGPTLYREQLEALGFEGVRVQELRLDAPFFVVTGRKPGG